MLLSEAIRLGAMMGPQAFGMYEDCPEKQDAPPGTCALGAALTAIGRRDLMDCLQPQGVDQQFPILTEVVVSPAFILTELTPVTSMADAIVGLNDESRWSREQIADWVAREEVRLGLRAEPVTEQVLDLVTA